MSIFKTVALLSLSVSPVLYAVDSATTIDHSKMDHSMHGEPSKNDSKQTNMDHEHMNRDGIDHSKMDHSMHGNSSKNESMQNHSMQGMHHDAMNMQSHMGDMQNMSKSMPAADSFDIPKNQPLQPLVKIQNESQTPGVFKATINVASQSVNILNDKATTLWLYNGAMLPIIDVNVGDKFDVNVVNHLNEDTTIHWHGLAVSPDQDGNPHEPIMPHKNEQYAFNITEQMAGSHWFHPHTYLKTSTQVAMGLAGLFIVRSANDPIKHIPEQNLFFSDLKLDENGQIAPNDMMDIMNGREGQFALINGQLQPEITLAGTQRWRIWNGNSARYLKLALPATEVDAFLVATDGGLIEKPLNIEELFLSPGERAEIVLTPKSDNKFELIAQAYNRQKMGPVDAEQDLVVAHVKMQSGEVIDLPSQLTQLESLGEPTITRKLVYTEEMMPMRFLINGQSHDMDRIDFTAKQGEVELWEVTNNTHMDHNFHLHGPQFQVVEFEKDNIILKPDYLLFKDTINIKPGETLRFLTRQDDPGIRMYHCHILEHEDAGMMGQVKIF